MADAVHVPVPEGVIIERTRALLGEYSGGGASVAIDIMQDLREEFGNSAVEEHQKAVRKAVDDHFTRTAKGVSEAPAAARKRDEPPATAEPAAKKKAKTTASASAQAQAGGDTCRVEISREIFASTQFYNGKKLLSIRKHFQKDGQWLPTKKGISLTAEQWETFCGVSAEVAACLRGGRDFGPVDLSRSKKVKVETYKGRCLASIREYYQKNGEGEWLPTQKGVSLGLDQWAKLEENMGVLTGSMAKA